MKKPERPKEQEPSTSLDEFIRTYDIFRRYGEHENLLINNRITWMLTIHGFLYATYGFTVQKLLEIIEKVANFESMHSTRPGQIKFCYMHALYPNVHQSISFLFCIVMVGFVISASAFFSIRAAYRASQTLHNIFYHNYTPSFLRYKTLPMRDKVSSQIVLLLKYLTRFQIAKRLIVRAIYFLRSWKIAPQPMKILKVGHSMFPILSGGGREASEISGGLASWMIPVILLISWIISAYYLYTVQVDINKVFFEREKCVLIPK